MKLQPYYKRDSNTGAGFFLCWSPFLNKVASLFEKETPKCFPINFEKFLTVFWVSLFGAAHGWGGGRGGGEPKSPPAP